METRLRTNVQSWACWGLWWYWNGKQQVRRCRSGGQMKMDICSFISQVASETQERGAKYGIRQQEEQTMCDQNWQHSTTSTCGTLASNRPSPETWDPFFVSHFGPKTGRRDGHAMVFLSSSCKIPAENFKYSSLYPSNQSDLHADYRTQFSCTLWTDGTLGQIRSM